MFFVDLHKIPSRLVAGMEALKHDFPLIFSAEPGVPELTFKPRSCDPEHGFRVSPQDGGGFLIEYDRRIDAFRALGRIFAGLDGKLEAYAESPCFPFIGMMLDASRNGVPNLDTIKYFLRRLALMGVNVFMLYTEDTYVVDTEPWFGYLRGPYTQDELRAADQYANALGIEMLPCIQTLGHLENLLKWPEYADVKDTFHTLMVDEPRTGELLRKMLTSASSPYASCRIHIGLDEARDLGTGQYRDRHGEAPVAELMARHIRRVTEICAELGLKPMIWNDCLFRNGDTFHGYYDPSIMPDPKLLAAIPDNLTMVHWDYWHHEVEMYRDYIDLHRECGYDPIMAMSPVTSARFWPAMEHAQETIAPCLDACRERNVPGVLLTIWGDDGMEVDLYANLAAAQFMADRCHVREDGRVVADATESNFRASCRAAFSDFVRAAHVDILPSMQGEKYRNANCSKWMLWDDPLLGMCEPFHADESLSGHYAALANELERGDAASVMESRLRVPARLARVLAIKADLRGRLVSAYRSADRDELGRIYDNDIPRLQQAIEELWQAHHEAWRVSFKPFGWEVLELRYGGLLLRVRTMGERISDLLNGVVDSIPEFETTLMPLQTRASRSFLNPRLLKPYSRIASPCRV